MRCNGILARAFGETIEGVVAGHSLSAVARQGAQGQTVAGLCEEGQQPFKRNVDVNALVETAFAEFLEGDIGECRPCADLHPGVEPPLYFECGTIVPGKITPGVHGKIQPIPWRLVIDGNMPGYGMIVPEIEQAVESALPDLIDIGPDGPTLTLWPPENLRSCTRKHVFKNSGAAHHINVGCYRCHIVDAQCVDAVYPVLEILIDVAANVRQLAVRPAAQDVVVPDAAIDASIQRQARQQGDTCLPQACELELDRGIRIEQGLAKLRRDHPGKRRITL